LYNTEIPNAILTFVLVVLFLLFNNPIYFTAATEVFASPITSTPIKHLVMIFQENVSFDHYFGTYPYVKNLPNEPAFSPSRDTPSVNGLTTANLLTNNPNLANPFRLDRSQPITCDMNHTYTAEQKAYDGGLLDKFVEFTGSKGINCNPKQVTPWAKMNFVDHQLTDQSSILRFIEDNWNLGRIGNQSFDVKAGSLMNMFDFTMHISDVRLFLHPGTGLISSIILNEK
jgi:phospholipase C